MCRIGKLLLVIPYFLLVAKAAPSREQQAEEVLIYDLNNVEDQEVTGRHVRQAIDTIRGPSNTWPNATVYYTFDVNLPKTRRDAFVEAVEFWQKNTCLKFFESATARNRILVFPAEEVCNSFIGAIGGQQTLNLGENCEMTARHELAHALGFWHSHMRPDRDEYITLQLENVYLDEQRRKNNFDARPAYEINNFGLPYDYGSLMHYGATHFAKRNTIVISAKDPSYQMTMGSPVGSFVDILMMNKLYSCEAICANRPPISCAYGGIPNPNDCSVCLCPRGFGGPTCELPTPDQCGSLYEADSNLKSDSKIVKPTPGQLYPTECTVHFKAPPGQEVELTLERNLPEQYGCPHMGYEVVAETETLRRGHLYCGNSPQKIVSNGGLIALIMYSSRELNFKYSYRAVEVPCEE